MVTTKVDVVPHHEVQSVLNYMKQRHVLRK